MKKPPIRTAPRRKLTLQREAIAQLAPTQLGNVAGGGTDTEITSFGIAPPGDKLVE
jgi:hypothetical protein